MRWTSLVGLIGALAVTGCSPGASDPSAAEPTAPDTSVATSPLTSSPSLLPTTPSPTPTPPHPVSIQALIQMEYDGGGLKLGEVLDETSSYTRYFVTYRSSGLTISGVMNVPNGDGPFPALVLNHGYIDPDVYTNGRGLRREQDYLARHGYVVLHTDYRNHAQSDDDPNAEQNLRLGYTEDVVNAVLALGTSGLPAVDPNRIGLLGRSMGGGVTYNVLVAQPGLVDAAVVYAPVSSNAVDNFDR